MKVYYPDGREETIEADIGTFDRQVIEEGEGQTEYIMPFLKRKIDKGNTK